MMGRQHRSRGSYFTGSNSSTMFLPTTSSPDRRHAGFECDPSHAPPLLFIDRPPLDRSRAVIRTLLIGYAFAIRSERRLFDEVHLNLAYRWFCRLVSGAVLDHSTLSKNGMAAFATVTCFGGCSRMWSANACTLAWSAVKASPSMPV